LVIPKIIELSHFLVENKTRYYSIFKLEYMSPLKKKKQKTTTYRLRKIDTTQILKQKVTV